MKLFGHAMREKDWVVVGGAAAAVAAAATLAQLHGSGRSGSGGTLAAFPGDNGSGVGGGGPGDGTGAFVSSVGSGNGSTPAPFTPSPTASPVPTPSQSPPPVQYAGSAWKTPKFLGEPLYQPPPRDAASDPRPRFDPVAIFPDHAPAPMPQIFQPPAADRANFAPSSVTGGTVTGQDTFVDPGVLSRPVIDISRLPDTSTLPGVYYTGPTQNQYLLSGPAQSPDARDRNIGIGGPAVASGGGSALVAA